MSSTVRNFTKFRFNKKGEIIATELNQYAIVTYGLFNKSTKIVLPGSNYSITSLGYVKITVCHFTDPLYYTKVINFNGYKFLVTISFKYSKTSASHALVFRMARKNDLGFLNETSDVIDNLMLKINEINPEVNKANIKTAQDLIEKSVLKLSSTYLLDPCSIKFVEFES